MLYPITFQVLSPGFVVFFFFGCVAIINLFQLQNLLFRIYGFVATVLGDDREREDQALFTIWSINVYYFPLFVLYTAVHLHHKICIVIASFYIDYLIVIRIINFSSLPAIAIITTSVTASMCGSIIKTCTHNFIHYANNPLCTWASKQGSNNVAKPKL